MDNKYIDVILDRWSEYTGKEPILVETADPTDARRGLAWSVIKSSTPQKTSKNESKNTAQKNAGTSEGEK